MTNQMNPKKGMLHTRSRHHGRYDFNALTQVCPELSAFVIKNPANENTIDFSNSDALRSLNKALLMFFYDVQFWELPSNYLCPPIPGRADYIHYLADLLAESNSGVIPRGKQVKVLDIGTGANCIYPIIGSQSYHWSFVGTDIDPVSANTAKLIINSNKNLKPYIKIRFQKDSASIFNHVIKKEDKFTLTMCNPPFHASMEKAQLGSARKIKNLNKGKTSKAVTLNFAGQENELCCAGGEIAFLKKMVNESVLFADQVTWFSSLVSKSENVTPIKKRLTELNARDIKVIKMAQGQKISRCIAWKF